MSHTEETNAPPEIKTDEKKQHFDDIYVQENPVAFKERIIDALDYISDDFNRQTFDRLILPWCENQSAGPKPLRYVDLCCCFGNTTLAIAHGMNVAEIRENWRDVESCQKIARRRRLPLRTTGIDISGNALAYGKTTGIFDRTIETDLNAPSKDTAAAVRQAMVEADVVISTASLVYLELPAIESIINSFAESPSEGYIMVNFLNPFALEKGDATKRLLLSHLNFVGSTASRHRRLSPLERENYPGEDWALLEIWVLRRKT